MKVWFASIASSVAVAVAFTAIGRADLEWGQEIVALWAAFVLLRVLFIPRYPKAFALREVFGRLKPGTKIEVEGK